MDGIKTRSTTLRYYLCTAWILKKCFIGVLKRFKTITLYSSIIMLTMNHKKKIHARSKYFLCVVDLNYFSSFVSIF